MRSASNLRRKRNLPKLKSLYIPGGALDQQKKTLELIGQIIIDGSRYLPIRNRAAALATTAAPKDYLGQVKAIYDGFLQNWRYVRDPFGRELVHKSPKQLFELVMGGRSNSPGVGMGKGAGDCDDAVSAIGAQLASVGFPVRLAVMAPPGASPGPLMSHVFAQARVPGYGWVTVDPVVHPRHGFGFTPPHSRLATYDLTGKLLSQTGNAQGLSGLGAEMQQPQRTDINQWTDYAGFGDYAEPNEELLDFRIYGVKDYGIYADTMGMSNGLGLMAEVDENDTDKLGRVWTPNIELAPEDYQYIRRTGAPYHGMLGLGDNLEPYVYDENLGFFRKIFKKIKKKVKNVKKALGRGARRLKQFGKKLLKKIPGGKYLLKLGSKVWKVAKKLVGPLMKYVGPIAKKLAPVAALIPGYGPAIAVALYKTGKIADLMKKFNVKSVAQKVGVSKLRFPSGEMAKRFQKALKTEAKKTKKIRKRTKDIRRNRIARGIRPIEKRRLQSYRGRKPRSNRRRLAA